MKTVKMIFSMLFVFSLISCNTTKITKKTPFKVLSATYNDSRKNNMEYNVTIKTSNPQIVLDSVYFRNNKAKLYFKEGYFKATVPKSILLKKDMVLHSDPKKEYGNTVDVDVKKNIPFDLKKEEAVVSYDYKGKKYYYKVTMSKEQLYK